MAMMLSIQVTRFGKVRYGQYLTYPKIGREQTWNFSLILSICDFKCNILDQNATINDRDIINTRDQGLDM